MEQCSCGRLVLKKGMKRHLTTEAHLRALGGDKETSPKEPSIQEEEDSGFEMYMEDEKDDFGIDSNDDFLGEFCNDKFETEKTKDELAEIKKESALLREKQKLDALKDKESNKFKKTAQKETGEDDNDIFSTNGSELIELERRTLLKKVQQYKFLFPKELKGFKIKKNATAKELEAYIAECEAIVSLDGTEKFVLDGLYQAIAVVEGVTALTQDWDISGLHLILKNNLQFQQLAKILFVKYNTFSKVAPEYQATFIVLTSAYICKMGNSQRKKMMRAQGQ